MKTYLPKSTRMKSWKRQRIKIFLLLTMPSCGKWRLKGILRRQRAWLCWTSVLTSSKKEILSIFCRLLLRTQLKAGFTSRLLRKSTWKRLVLDSISSFKSTCSCLKKKCLTSINLTKPRISSFPLINGSELNRVEPSLEISGSSIKSMTKTERSGSDLSPELT